MYDTLNLVRLTGLDKKKVQMRAEQLGLKLTDKHWDVIYFVKNFYDYQEGEELQVKDYNHALAGKYAQQGGLKYLYRLFPQGPVKTTTQLADIPSVQNIQNFSMGSVH